MKILAPVNSIKDARAVVEAGAGEVYCGILPVEWSSKYSNAASANRREWKTANLGRFEDLKGICGYCRGAGVDVLLALNALYTSGQYPMVFEQIEKALECGVSGFIMADIGLLWAVKRRGMRLKIHISTGGTVFNSRAAMFYQDLGASRIVLPRHIRVDETAALIKRCPGVEFEVFVLNSGCKNIDGFCTFHHGVNELLHPGVWDFFKKLNFDRHVLNLIKKMPPAVSGKIKGEFFGIDSACLLNYSVSYFSRPAPAAESYGELLRGRIEASFNLMSGIDTCGACRIKEFKDAGVCGVKIVGRNYSTSKKKADVSFLKAVIDSCGKYGDDAGAFRKFVRARYRKVYGADCRELCYYPDGT